ncbi:hypothetical protein [Lysobacter gummosus]|uniref:hypothetical protein n=1 Tax=Lysobacter gummosus TaxID=262324 RepID=UPI0036251448
MCCTRRAPLPRSVPLRKPMPEASQSAGMPSAALRAINWSKVRSAEVGRLSKMAAPPVV